MASVDEYREAQAAEWGQYVAAETIFIGDARAFNEGDPVPVSHVKSGVVDKKLVRDVTSSTAAKKG